MNRILKTLRVLAMAAIIAAGAVAQGEAAPIVSISPSSQVANFGDTVSIDIIVTGLTEAVGGYSLYLGFNDAVLTGDSYTNDPGGAMGAGDDFGFGFGANDLDLFYIADATWDAATLAGAQGASFTLATVTFLAIANGVSPLAWLFVDLSDAAGDSLLLRSTQNGQVCVGGPCPVPEPGLLILMMTGVATVAVRRRARLQA